MPPGFGKNGAITNAVNGVKKSMDLSFMSSSQPLTMEEAAASAASAKPEDIVILDNKVFLKSLKRAIEDPVGMPAAILDWHQAVRNDTVGIEIPSAPAACPIDPRVVEYVCKTNAANYRDRLLPDIFRLVLKDLGVTGSQGEYNRQHRKVCQKPFINNNFLKTFSVWSSPASRTCAIPGRWPAAPRTAPRSSRTWTSTPSISSSTSSPPSLSTTIPISWRSRARSSRAPRRSSRRAPCSRRTTEARRSWARCSSLPFRYSNSARSSASVASASSST